MTSTPCNMMAYVWLWPLLWCGKYESILFFTPQVIYRQQCEGLTSFTFASVPDDRKMAQPPGTQQIIKRPRFGTVTGSRAEISTILKTAVWLNISFQNHYALNGLTLIQLSL